MAASCLGRGGGRQRRAHSSRGRVVGRVRGSRDRDKKAEAAARGVSSLPLPLPLTLNPNPNPSPIAVHTNTQVKSHHRGVYKNAHAT